MILRKIFIFVILLLLPSVSCAQSPEDAIIGYWESENGAIEFFDDGTVILDEGIVGNYTILDETRLRIDGQSASLVFDFEVSGDTLTLSDNGETLVFQRGNGNQSSNTDGDNQEFTEAPVCQGAEIEVTRIVLSDANDRRVPVPTPDGGNDPCFIEVTRVVNVENIEESMDDFVNP